MCLAQDQEVQPSIPCESQRGQYQVQTTNTTKKETHKLLDFYCWLISFEGITLHQENAREKAPHRSQTRVVPLSATATAGSIQ